MNRSCPKIVATVMQKALSAVNPAQLIATHLDGVSAKSLTVVGVGKAAAKMALAVENALGRPAQGMVIVPYGYQANCRWITVLQGAHPVPDQNAIDATKQLQAMLKQSSGPVLALVSGGGSSVLSAPAPFISFAQKQSIISQLLSQGCPIAELNLVRSGLSSVKAAGLAQLVDTRDVRVLVLSDVASNDPHLVASGPFADLQVNPNQILEILKIAKISVSAQIKSGLLQLKSNYPVHANIETRLIGTGDTALQAAAKWADEQGIITRVLGDHFEADAGEIAKMHHKYIQQAKADGVQLLLSGGEANVRVMANGQGGPNRHFLLSLLLELARENDFSALAIDTDGIDGSDAHAGAWCDQHSLAQAISIGLDPNKYLQATDSGRFFNAINTSIHTGPTGTNVNDFRAILLG